MESLPDPEYLLYEGKCVAERGLRLLAPRGGAGGARPNLSPQWPIGPSGSAARARPRRWDDRLPAPLPLGLYAQMGAAPSKVISSHQRWMNQPMVASSAAASRLVCHCHTRLIVLLDKVEPKPCQFYLDVGVGGLVAEHWNIGKDVRRLSEELGINVRELEKVEEARVMDNVFALYTQGHRYSWAMWDSRFFAESVGRQSEDAWRWCGDFVGNSAVLLFFNLSDEESMFEVVGSGALIQLIGEMFHVEFYLTDESNSYLLCYNHHSFLIACGAAREWLTNYQPPS